MYLRVASLGDSTTVGIGDPVPGGWRGWARLLAEALGTAYDVSFCNLAVSGATAATVRSDQFFGLPGLLRRPLAARIETVNRVYDEVHATYGGVRLDLATRPEVTTRRFWSVDRLHPSELGHRALAHAYAELLAAEGLTFELPGRKPEGGYEPSWRRDLAWMLAEGAPWVDRRARDGSVGAADGAVGGVPGSH